MPNPFEMDWTKPEGHEMYDQQDPNWGGQKDNAINSGNSGGLACALEADGRLQIMGLENWSKKPPQPSTAILENLRQLKKEKLETITFLIMEYYHPISPGNYEWNTGNVPQDRNYPPIGKE